MPNLLGSIILVVTAYIDRQWGFFVLEVSWVIVLTHAVLARRPAPH